MYRGPKLYSDWLLKMFNKVELPTWGKADRKEWSTYPLHLKARIVFSWYLKKIPNVHTLSIQEMANEYHWLKWKQSRLVFPESREFCERLLQASFDIDYLPMPPFRQFALMLPHGFKICGVEMHGLFVSVVDRALHDMTHNLFLQDMGFDLSEHVTIGDQWCLSVTMNCPKLDASLQSGSLQTYLVSSYADEIGRLLNCPADEFHNNVKSVTHDGRFPMGNEDQAYKQAVMRFVAALLIYIHALPDSVVSGMPAPKSDSPTFKECLKRSQGGILVRDHTPADTKGKAAHYRSWHFATLRDKRYYQGEFAHLEPGSRIVFRKASMVNSNAAPVTVLDDEP